MQRIVQQLLRPSAVPALATREPRGAVCVSGGLLLLLGLALSVSMGVT